MPPGSLVTPSNGHRRQALVGSVRATRTFPPVRRAAPPRGATRATAAGAGARRRRDRGRLGGRSPRCSRPASRPRIEASRGRSASCPTRAGPCGSRGSGFPGTADERYGELDRRARGGARGALGVELARTLLFRESTIAGRFVGLGAVDGLGRWGSPTQRPAPRRLPSRSGARSCGCAAVDGFRARPASGSSRSDRRTSAAASFSAMRFPRRESARTRPS